MTFEGTLIIDIEGNPKIKERKYFLDWCKENQGKTCEIKIKKLGRKSDPLRRYYFGVVVELYRGAFRNLGNNFTKEDTHNLIKTFCPSMKREMMNPATGEIISYYQSIADKSFTNSDFLTYLEELKQWAAENLDMIIPDPNEL